jgi:hypothetical protein
VPARSLAPDEVLANVRYFAKPGPRGRPVSSLVISGLPAAVDPLAPAVREARAASVRRVVVHVDGPRVAAVQGSSLGPLVDALVVAVRRAEDLRGVGTVTSGPALEVVVPLEDAVLPQVREIAAAARRVLVPRVTFTWPFPAGDQLPPAAELAIEAIRVGAAELGPTPWTVKGLPPCALGSLVDPERVFRSSNRWYVDADHQLDRALLFFPEVVRYSKRELCRFCELDPRCDGVADRWLRSGVAPELRPVRRSA